MVLLAGVLVLAAIGLLATGVAQGSTDLQWSAVVVSTAAAVVLAVQAVRDRGASSRAPVAPSPPDPEPPVEGVEVGDLLVVLELTDEVLVLHGRPRYHLAGCRHLTGHAATGLPLVEARSDGFTACGACAPDRHLADRERTRRAPSRNAPDQAR